MLGHTHSTELAHVIISDIMTSLTGSAQGSNRSKGFPETGNARARGPGGAEPIYDRAAARCSLGLTVATATATAPGTLRNIANMRSYRVLRLQDDEFCHGGESSEDSQGIFDRLHHFLTTQ